MWACCFALLKGLYGSFVEGLALMSRSSVDGGMSGRTYGAGLLSVSWKCIAHLPRCSSSLEIAFLVIHRATGVAVFFPERVLVISCSLFMFLWSAAVSASAVSSSIKLRFSLLALF